MKHIKFYKNQKEKKPEDEYPIQNDTNLTFPIMNWLAMYPQGRVVVENLHTRENKSRGNVK
jgi:hypothetical protein